MRAHPILVLFLALATISPTSAVPPWEKSQKEYRTVYILNFLSNNKELLVHCKSEDDDIGVQNVVNGGGYHFSFVPSYWPPWGTTLFWCYVAPDDKSHAAFDAFWDSDNDLLDKTDLVSIIWIVKDEGVFLRNTMKDRLEFMHKWEAGRELKKNKHYTLQNPTTPAANATEQQCKESTNVTEQ